MEENTKLELEGKKEEKFPFDFQTIYTTLILNWKWFILSLIACLGLAAVYLRYTIPIYQATAKLLIKDDGNNNSRYNRYGIQGMTTLGTISNSNGLENEMEILKSHSIATQAVRDLRLYVTYKGEGRVKDTPIYKDNPINVDIDPAHLERINRPIELHITHTSNGYHITGTYYQEGNYSTPLAINKTLTQLPATIGLRSGILSFNNNTHTPLPIGSSLDVTISSPSSTAYKYIGALSVNLPQKTSSIAQLTLTDPLPQRAIDYLKQLVICYNSQANEDKNEVARRTEEFINGRLEKINAELGNTEGQLESYKRAHHITELKENAGQAIANQSQLDQQLADANMQVSLLNSINNYMNQPDNKYQTLPSNVGLTDASATQLISKYNDIVLERKHLLRSASESSPAVQPLTSQLDDLSASIRRAMNQARRNMEIQRNNVAAQFNKYSGRVSQTPEQERILTQIGRQQDVKSGLYLMLLQKREENSISLAATADKGRLIDEPQFTGKVSPQSMLIILIAFGLGIAIPALILIVIRFFHYKIESHNDVVSLTRLPILADVAVASDTAKTKASIVVHENQNNQMEEIFRSMRTNLQFILKENEKVIMFTSTTSGEGKTFNAANLSISFALLGKKVVLVGLDIRKPRLAELFEINDRQRGITSLLTRENLTMADVKTQILPSGINNNLDLLMAGTIPPNPAELVARKSLDQIIDFLKEAYDYIIIDTAPVGLVTDTLQIGRVADATVYLCRADYTSKESFDLVNELNEEKKLPKMCVVINGIDMSKKKNRYYYGYGNYGKYGRYGHYGRYGSHGSYGYGSYGNNRNSYYGDKNDTSIKR